MHLISLFFFKEITHLSLKKLFCTFSKNYFRVKPEALPVILASTMLLIEKGKIHFL